MARLDLKKGDLVCLFRRKTPGIGIVMRRHDSVLEELQEGSYYQFFMDMYLDAINWRARKKACDYLIINSELDEDLVYAFLLNNSFFGMGGTPNWKNMKSDFIYVRWFSSPSNYEASRLEKDILWLPTEWFKKLT